MTHHHHDPEEAYNTVQNAPHKAELSHELIAAAASFAAMKAYNNHLEKEGKPASHDTAKELLAAAGGAFIDRMVETKGLDFIDKQKAKHQAKERAEANISGHY
ncbi:hypothetical protein BV22DRAFT_1066623 [Leucogyrophana mollusca]|uniref:Uncharacterized protein n=1 Tax=Leucogyrophana mollusca TaxID=85980 RepID=A0ACB8BH34_9AGAM|nr:hypothetical protein BV22DRAFT_1066623 [Leucogyrophana mollusca]